MPIVLDTSRNGLEKVLRDYQIKVLEVIWKNPDKGLTSREICDHVNKILKTRTVSRASIINFLNEMCEYDVIKYETETCKGGARRKYFQKLDEEGFKRYIAKMVIESLIKDFPEQTIMGIYDSLENNPLAAEKLIKLVNNSPC
ncbi:BlaI/MecI/CopY family transcriptional regulator [Candidatus Bathyarchaeota archaeon]|nr:BlaI/MecI/CopY family transcriptional regulator [Candidatus Bathyarchaeota archaeon]